MEYGGFGAQVTVLVFEWRRFGFTIGFTGRIGLIIGRVGSCGLTFTGRFWLITGFTGRIGLTIGCVGSCWLTFTGRFWLITGFTGCCWLSTGSAGNELLLVGS